MSTYFCKTCDNNSWSEPFENDQCDKCWDKEQIEDCKHEWKYYDGCLGYESEKCTKCNVDIKDLNVVGKLCPKYGEQVLPDDEGMCSLCGEHEA